MSWWSAVLGLVVVGVAAYDVLSTTLVTTSRAGPLTARLARLVWRIGGRLARSPRAPILAGLGPTIVVLTIVVWLALLWAGWSLVFAADPDAVVSATGARPADGWARWYYAGFTVFTLGVGDYVPGSSLWQLVTVASVASGLGITTMAVTYLIPVVTAVTVRRTQANSIAGLGTDPYEVVTAGWHHGSFSMLEARLSDLTDQVLLTAERHLSYPVLHFFHSRSPQEDFRRQLHKLDEAVMLLTCGVTDEARPHPLVLRRAKHAVEQLVRNAVTPETGDVDPGWLDLERLRAAGIPTVSRAGFEDRLASEHEHRRRVAAYAGESHW